MLEYKEFDPEFKELLLKNMQKRSPFWSLLGMELIDVKRGWAKVRLPYAEKLENAMGSAHGGAIFSTVDASVGVALFGLVEEDETFSTIDIKINYLKTFNKGEITAEARIIHKGSKIALGDVEVKDADGDLLTKGLVTYMILKRKK